MSEKELLLSGLLNCKRHELYLNRPLLDKKQEEEFNRMLKMRSEGLPLQYILGFCEFMGFRFKVDKAVFIPRPETEILVETAIEIGLRVKGQGVRIKILDIGTGSGCIAVSLAKLLPAAKLTAIDISEEALAIAQENAFLNKARERIEFLCGDLFSPFKSYAEDRQYDIIISNPPYIRRDDLGGLPQEVRGEPLIALDGGIDGQDFYRRIINHAPGHLKEGGFLIMELGLGQAESVKAIAQYSGEFEALEIIKDYNGIDRVIVLVEGEKCKVKSESLKL